MLPQLLPVVTLEPDHVRIRLPTAGAALALRRELLFPYSIVGAAEAAEPEWPPVLTPWRLGTHLPAFVCAGSFWKKRRRHFCYFARGDRVLKLTLAGIEFAVVQIAVPDPDRYAAEIAARIARRG